MYPYFVFTIAYHWTNIDLPLLKTSDINGPQWEVLRFDLPLTEVKFIYAIGWHETRNKE